VRLFFKMSNIVSVNTTDVAYLSISYKDLTDYNSSLDPDRFLDYEVHSVHISVYTDIPLVTPFFLTCMDDKFDNSSRYQYYKIRYRKKLELDGRFDKISNHLIERPPFPIYQIPTPKTLFEFCSIQCHSNFVNSIVFLDDR
jgi:hypothetical protein